MTNLTLIQLPPSPNNVKVRLAMAIKNLDYDSIEIDFAHRGDRSLVIEASGQPLTPVLKDGERTIFDSYAIVRYLDANWPKPRLYSVTVEGQREIEDWEVYTRTQIQETVVLVVEQAFKGEVDDAKTALAQARLIVHAKKIEAALQGSDFLCGHRVTAADITAAPFLRFAVANPAELPEGPTRFIAERLPLGPEFPKTRAWIQRVMALESVPLAV